MSTPVKTDLMKTLEILLNEVAGIATVRRWYDIPFDLDKVETPALFFWEEPEDMEAGNLIVKNVLHLNLAVFIKLEGEINNIDSPAYQTFVDQAELIAGQLHALWWDSYWLASLRLAGLLQVEELGNRKALSSETYGEMVLTARLTYAHRLGDASDLTLH